MNQIFPTLFLLILSLGLCAQHPTCNGTRYLTEEFTNVDTTFKVLYGVNTTFAGNTDSLLMDVYQPIGDTASMRPLLILAFGGSFVVGVREDMAPLCHYYAQRGFVTATIDYRLYDGPFFPFPDSTDFADVVIKAIGDMKASIRYFREDAATTNNYKIDPSLVFIGGGSAGAIVSLNVAYLDSMDNIPAHILAAVNANGGFEGNTTNNYQYPSDVQGVLNFSGALGDASWVDAGDAPVFSVHDDGDNVVPYGQGYATVANIPISYLEGSKIIHDTATSLGITSILITIPNSTGHVSYVNNPTWQDSVFTSTCVFFNDIICPIISTIEPTLATIIPTQFYPNPTENVLNVEIPSKHLGYDLFLYDNMGRVVYQQQNIQDDRFELQRQSLPAGIYVVQIQFKDKQAVSIQKKVVFL